MALRKPNQALQRTRPSNALGTRCSLAAPWEQRAVYRGANGPGRRHLAGEALAPGATARARGSSARTNGSNGRSNGLGARLSREAHAAAAVAWQQPQPRDGARRAAAAGAAEAAGAAGGSGGVLPRPASAAAGGRSAQRPLPPLPRGSLRGAGSAGRGSGAQVPTA